MPAPARCTCGYTKFATRVDRTTLVDAMRWRQTPPAGGLGSVIMGGTLGAAQGGWGRYAVQAVTGVHTTFCEACERVRRQLPIGGGTVVASWADDSAIYALMSDVAATSCMSARFSLRRGSYVEADIDVVQADVEAEQGTPLEICPKLPPGAVVADTIYRIALPDVDDAGVYQVVLFDRCLETLQPLGSAILGTNIDVYGRSGDVLSLFGDYSTDLVLAGGGGDQTLTEALDELGALVADRAVVARDLGGLADAPKAVGLQGRDVAPQGPVDGSILTWSGLDDHWEPR